MKALVVLYDGFAEFEYEIPVLAFYAFDIAFDVVGLESPSVTGMIGLRANVSQTLDQVDPSLYSALILPGIEPSTREKAMNNETLMALIREYDQAKKIIAAVCAAPVLLGQAGILKNRRFCSDARDQPAFQGAVRVEGPVVRDEHLITGLGSRIFHFTALLVEALTSQEKAKEYRQWAGISI